MKQLFIILIFLFNFNAKAGIVLKSQKEVDSFKIFNINYLLIENDTSLPISEQIHDISNITKNLMFVDGIQVNGTTYGLEIRHTRIAKISKFEKLTYSGYSKFTHNPLLKEIEGFPQLKSGYSILIDSNAILENVNLNMDSCTEILGLRFINNNQLMNVSIHLANHKQVSAASGVQFTCKNNLRLKNIQLKSINKVFTVFYIEKNDSLQSIFIEKLNNTPENLLFQSTFLNITNSVNSFQNLGGAFFVNDNPQLERIYGFEKDSFLILYSKIYNNPKLKDLCFLKRALDNFRYVQCKPEQIYQLADNGSNASSIEDVKKSTCTPFAHIAENQASMHPFTFFPNPSNDIVQIQFEGEFTISLFSLSGQKIMQQTGNHHLKWNVAQIQTGIYILELKAQGQVFRDRMVIEH